MDELAYATGTDSLALRLKNYSERDENEDKPYTSKKLRTALQVGAERFGWSRRTPEPRSMRDGRELVGWGMAGGAWKAKMSKISASARLTADGKLVVASATADIGSGTCTILTQIAADALGPPMEAVAAKVGDSSLPTSPVEGGVQGNAGLQEEGTAHGGNLALSVASGALYGALKPNGVTPVEAGLAFGMGFLALAYGGAGPALRVTPPPTRDTPASNIQHVAVHALFGVAMALVADRLERRLAVSGPEPRQERHRRTRERAPGRLRQGSTAIAW